MLGFYESNGSCQFDKSRCDTSGKSEVAKQSIAASCLPMVAAFGLYQNLFAASVGSVTLRLTAFFRSTYLCEEAYSQMLNK